MWVTLKGRIEYKGHSNLPRVNRDPGQHYRTGDLEGKPSYRWLLPRSGDLLRINKCLFILEFWRILISATHFTQVSYSLTRPSRAWTGFPRTVIWIWLLWSEGIIQKTESLPWSKGSSRTKSFYELIERFENTLADTTWDVQPLLWPLAYWRELHCGLMMLMGVAEFFISQSESVTLVDHAVLEPFSCREIGRVSKNRASLDLQKEPTLSKCWPIPRVHCFVPETLWGSHGAVEVAPGFAVGRPQR